MRTNSQEKLVAVFKTVEDARQAKSKLIRLGIAESDLALRTSTVASRGADSLFGSIAEFFGDLFSADDEQKEKAHLGYYNQELSAGNSLLIINSAQHRAKAIEILDGYGALNNYDRKAATGTSTEEQVLTLRKEKLAIDKQSVKTGEVRVSKEITTEQKTIEVPLKREEVVIERRDVSSTAADGTPIASNTETIRVPVMEEKLDVSKVTVPKEEVVISKQTHTNSELVQETVREEEIDVEEVDEKVAAQHAKRSQAAHRGTQAGV